MQLLISTSKSFLCLDSKTGEQQVLHQDMGLYYGICYSDTKIYVAAPERVNLFPTLEVGFLCNNFWQAGIDGGGDAAE